MTTERKMRSSAALTLWIALGLFACSSSDPSQTILDGTAPAIDVRYADAQVIADAGTVDSGVVDSGIIDSGLIPLDGPHAQVVVAVANIRNQPVAAQAGDYSKDTYQETQVLFGDLLSITQEQGDWYEVAVLDQLIYDDASGTFKPYPGWIQKKFVQSITTLAPANITVTAQTTALLQLPDPSAQVMATLSVGTLLAALGPSTATGLQEVRLPGGGSGWVWADDVQPNPSGSPTISRAGVITSAERFLGATYLWGGYSAPMGNAYQIASTGVDCSGLSGLVYRSLGLMLPRNSGDQYRGTQPISLGDLERGDLVFSSSTSSADGISHVLIFDDGEQLIEGSSLHHMVRWTTFSDKFGASRQELNQLGGQVSSTKYVLASRVKGVTWLP